MTSCQHDQVALFSMIKWSCFQLSKCKQDGPSGPLFGDQLALFSFDKNIYVQNNGSEGEPDMPGTPGWQIHPAVTPETGDIVIQKRTPDSFHETNLQSELEARQIRRLIIAGMQTDMCIDATSRRAHELGYDVTLVKDAHSTFDGGGRTAAQIIAQYNDALRAVVKVEEASNITFG
jgi:nicotinamidase-related amidase